MIRISPPNSIVFICDPSSREVDVPEYVTGQLIAATQSCISVGTLAEMDGETEISLSDVPSSAELGELVFDGMVRTPGRVVAVCNARDETLLSLPVSSVAVRVKVFANDRSEPDRIVVLALSQIADPSTLH
jgi:hypothetical protein